MSQEAKCEQVTLEKWLKSTTKSTIKRQNMIHRRRSFLAFKPLFLRWVGWPCCSHYYIVPSRHWSYYISKNTTKASEGSRGKSVQLFWEWKTVISIPCITPEMSWKRERSFSKSTQSGHLLPASFVWIQMHFWYLCSQGSNMSLGPFDLPTLHSCPVPRYTRILFTSVWQICRLEKLIWCDCYCSFHYWSVMIENKSTLGTGEEVTNNFKSETIVMEISAINQFREKCKETWCRCSS